MTVWKFTLTGPDTTIPMPVGAKVLSVGEQDGQIVLWAEVSAVVGEQEQRRFRAFNTGAKLPEGTLKGDGLGSLVSSLMSGTPIVPSPVYLGTVQIRDAGIVWHVYELPLEAEKAAV